jgi:hypothetical protein
LGEREFKALAPLPPRRFSRQIWAIIALLVLLQAGLVGIVVFLNHNANQRLEEENAEADRRLQEAMAEADRLDPHWRLEEIQARRAVLRDQENAAQVVIVVKKLMPPRWPSWDYPPSEDPQGRAEEERRTLQDSFEKLEPPAQLHERQITALRTELKRARTALVEARKLVDLPNGRHAVTYAPDYLSTAFPHIQDARDSTTLLVQDALLRAQEQDVAGALVSCRGAFNAARSIGDEPSLIAQLVRLACRGVALARLERTLAQGQARETSLAAFQKLLDKEGQVPLLLIGVRGERAGLNRLMHYLETGDPIKNAEYLRALRGFGKEEKDVPPLSPAEIKTQHAALLRYLTQGVEIAKLPLKEQARRFSRLEADIKNQSHLVRLLAPALIKFAEAFQRGQAQLRCAVVALAVERYRLAHQGRWPDSLAPLVPGYLARVPTDPFDGTPLRFRRNDAGVVIYSVGPDGKDNGGRIDRDRPREPGTDMGFQLWEMAKRRQPAQPFPPRPPGPPNIILPLGPR